MRELLMEATVLLLTVVLLVVLSPLLVVACLVGLGQVIAEMYRAARNKK